MVVQMSPYRRRYAQKAAKTSPVSSAPSTFLVYFAGKRLNRALYHLYEVGQELEHLQLVAAKRTRLTNSPAFFLRSSVALFVVLSLGAVDASAQHLPRSAPVSSERNEETLELH